MKILFSYFRMGICMSFIKFFNLFFFILSKSYLISIQKVYIPIQIEFNLKINKVSLKNELP